MKFKLASSQRIYIMIVSVIVLSFIVLFRVLSPYDTSFKEDGVVKITYADNISFAHKKLISIFNKLHRGKIEVVPIDLPFSKFSTDQRKELFARYFRSKSDRIDVFAVDMVDVPRFARYATSLNQYLSEVDKSSFLNYALVPCTSDSGILAMPLYLDISVMYYRKDIIKRLPDSTRWMKLLSQSITWDDFIKLYHNFSDRSHPFFVFQADGYEGLMCMYSEVLSNLGGEILGNGSLELNNPRDVDALEFLVDLVNRYKISPAHVCDLKEDESYKFFAETNGVFLRAWPALAQNNFLIQNYPKVMANLVVAPLPHIRGSKPAFAFGGFDLMISKYSTKVPEAVEFLQFLGSKQAQEIMYENGGFLPTNRLVYEDSMFVRKHPELMFYIHLFNYGVFRPKSEEYTRISDILSYYLHLAIKRKMTAREALRTAQQTIESEMVTIK